MSVSPLWVWDLLECGTVLSHIQLRQQEDGVFERQRDCRRANVELCSLGQGPPACGLPCGVASSS